MFRAPVLILLAASSCVFAQLPGPCPDPETLRNFNVTGFAGVWFDQAHTKRGTGLELKCDQVKFKEITPSKLEFCSFSYSSATKNVIHVKGDAEVQSNSGKLRVNIPSLSLHGEVRVLSTDYKTFAVLWACSGTTTHTERSLILTRDKHPSSALMKAAMKVLENNNISKSDINESTQHKCPEYNLNTSQGTSPLGSATSMGSLLPANTPTSTTPTFG